MDERAIEIYNEVLRRIREAKQTQASELDLSFALPDGLEPVELSEIPADLHEVQHLTALNLSGWIELRDLTPLSGLSALQSLNLSYCDQIRDLTPLSGLSALQSLDVSSCDQIRDLTPLSGLSALQSLNVTRCEKISDLTPLSGLSALQSLDVSWCQQISDLAPLSGLSALQSLDVSSCAQIRDLTPLSGLSALQSLNLYYCAQIRDLTPLSGLSALQSLNLYYCDQIRDLTPLSGLSALQSLNVTRCEKISDLTPLSGLSALQSLDVSSCQQLRDLTPLSGLSALLSLTVSSCQQLRDLTPLSGLSALQSLTVSSCQQLRDLTPLSGLSALQSLTVSGCEQISDLTPLSGLSALQSLTVSSCQQLRDLTPLSGLSALQSLDVSWCDQMISDLTPLSGLSALQSLNVTRCEKISDLTPLSGLSALQSLDVSWCDQISDLTPLSGLSALQSLNVSYCYQISDLTPLSGLSALQSLNVSYCYQISDLTPLSGLSALQSLTVSGCSNYPKFDPLIGLLSTLNKLIIYNTQWADLPAEICGENDRDNVLPKVRAHFQDLWEEPAMNAEVKVLFLGNGGVGKSQLCRRLKDLPYDSSVPTTHGIQLSQKSLQLENIETPVTLNLWDFGGQEIYHGSHTLFLQGQSIFLLLWTPAKEQTALYQEQGVPMRTRPLPYWLDYLRWFAGTKAPLLLIQSQCDTIAQRIQHPPGIASIDDFQALQFAHVSAKTGLGLDLVKAGLKEAVRYSLENRPPAPIGAGRARVRDRLRILLAADQERSLADRQHRWLERSYFDQLCKEAGGVSDTEALLDFLHHSGVIFYRPGLFSGRIILDQNWALEAIYTLFDRQKVLPLLRGNGRFSRADLEFLAWSAYSRDEQLVFLGMMESCGICFKSRKLANQEWEYIAPELLPAWSDAQDQLLAGRLLYDPPSEEVEAEYPFLHEGVLRNFLSRIGQKAGENAIYWKYGCWFYERKTDTRVLLESHWQNTETESGPGAIHFRAWGQRASELLEPLLEELRSLPVGRPPDFKKSQPVHSTAKPLALQDLEIATAVQPAAGQPTVYVSYAWGFDKIVDELCTALQATGWNVIRDRNTMRPGDLISDFMKTITVADRIIVVLSEKYLSSPFCMTELYGIYERSRASKQEFLQHVIPLSLDDAQFSNWRDRARIAKHWRTESEEMKANIDDLAASDLMLFHAIRNWHTNVGDMLAYVSDTLHPHGFAAIEQNSFSALKEMLRRRSRAASS